MGLAASRDHGCCFAVHQPCCDGTAAIAILKIAGVIDDSRRFVYPVTHGVPQSDVMTVMSGSVKNGLRRFVYIDCAPSDDVIEAARGARVFLEVLDHHASERARLTAAADAHPDALSFVYGEGTRCGAVLALEWAERHLAATVMVRKEVVDDIAVTDTTGKRTPMGYALARATLDEMVHALTSSDEEFAALTRQGEQLLAKRLAQASALLAGGRTATICGFQTWVAVSDDPEIPILANDAATELWATGADAPEFLVIVMTRGDTGSASVRVNPSSSQTCLALVDAVKATSAEFGGGGHARAAGIQGHKSAWATLGVEF